MTKKHTQTTLDVSIEYAVIGLDLAKYDVSLAAVTLNEGEVILIDRVTYAELYEIADKLSPTLFAVEPCNGYSQLNLELEARGHEMRVISGKAVKMWIDTHMSGQKTDINDALALARLTADPDLRPIRAKSLEECRIMTVQGVRQQLVGQRTKTIVSFKGFAQAWGIGIPAGRRNLKKMREAVEAKAELMGAAAVSALTTMLDRVKTLDDQIHQLDKDLEALVSANANGRLLKSVMGVGTQIAGRFITVVGDVKRFEKPRSLVAYIGCVPKNFITGHVNKPRQKKSSAPDLSSKGQGRISRRGDKLLRSLLMQGAACIYMQYCKRQLPDCQLTKWIDKQLAVRKPYGKIMVSLAAKLIRIAWAVLFYGEKFDIHRAGVPRSVLAAMASQSSNEDAAAA